MNTTYDFTPLPGAAQHSMTIADLHKDYQSGVRTPEEVFADIRARAKLAEDHTIFLHLLTEEEINPYLDALKQKPIETHPLWGVPFAIKDNIDLAGIPTTAGCEPFTYKPDNSACVVQQLIDAGAIPVGKPI
jgi:allophanate hydrolase